MFTARSIAILVLAATGLTPIAQAAEPVTGNLPRTAAADSTVGQSRMQTQLPGEAPGLSLIWQSQFTDALNDWPGRPRGWGDGNRSFTSDPGIVGQAMRVALPKGSIDPGTMKRRGQPPGGTGFKSRLPGQGFDIARLQYKVRFPADFEQGMGGKLPGLCGGTCNAGGKMPDGTDGFSARYMWTGNFAASVYAYLPSSRTYGTPIGSRQIPLRRAVWVELTQEVKLNTADQADGHIKVWADGVLVVDAQGLVMRTRDSLKIDQVFVDVFYGGNTDAWAAPKDTAVEFAEFAVWGR